MVYQTSFAIRLCFLQSLKKKIAQFLFAGVISFSFLAILTDDAFRHQCKRITSYPMT